MATSSPRRPLSLLGRLLITAGLWCALAVGIAAAVLIGLFGAHLEREADRDLHDDLVELVSLARIERSGALRLAGRLPGTRYQRPFSGWAWQIRRGPEVLAQSPSLGPAGPRAAALLAPRGQAGVFDGPGGQALRGLSRAVSPPLSTDRLIFAVARPQDEIEQSVRQYRGAVVAALGALGVGLVATVLVAFRIGLRPLQSLRLQILRLRAGGGMAPRSWPRELAPIAAELQTLRDQTERTVRRARGLSADLAHAIKTPLSVIRQQAGTLAPDERDALRRQADRIAMSLERHLGRSGAGGVPYTRVRVRACVEDLVFALTRAVPERASAVDVEVAEDAVFLGDEADLYEIIGNPLDNAGMWARSRIRVGASVSEARLLVTIEDDGPGIPEAERDGILERGRRLDEAAPGTGLGLAILRDLAEVYGGGVELGESPLGGLAVRVSLPGAVDAG